MPSTGEVEHGLPGSLFQRRPAAPDRGSEALGIGTLTTARTAFVVYPLSDAVEERPGCARGITLHAGFTGEDTANAILTLAPDAGSAVALVWAIRYVENAIEGSANHDLVVVEPPPVSGQPFKREIA